MNRNRPLALACLTLVGLLGSSCDSAGPVAPNGTTLIVTAAPTRIGVNGTSEITVIGRKPDGNPLLRDTEIRLSTSLGTVPALVLTDGNGVARATLRADGRSGKATVSATTVGGGGGTTGGGTTGGGTTGGTTGGSGTVEIQVGETAETKPTLIVTVNPNNVAINETATVTILARNSDGSPVEVGREIFLVSNLGSLSPARPKTASGGVASSSFRAGTTAGTATITAVLDNSDAVTSSVTIRDFAAKLVLSVSPSRITTPGAANTVNIEAVVNNARNEPVSGLLVTFETENSPKNPSPSTDATDNQGRASATISFAATDLDDTPSFFVVATVPSGPNTQITKRFKVCVTEANCSPGLEDD